MKAFVQALRSSASARTALGLVLGLGLLLGHFVWHTFVQPPRRSYPVRFTAPWITYPEGDHGIIYYRKRLHLDGRPRHGWLQVMALDRFEVYVNGNRLGAVDRPGTTATGIYDLTNRLHPGENLLAVRTDKETYPGTGRIAIEGAFTDVEGAVHRLQSDVTWRASVLSERAETGPRWVSAEFDDVAWPPARVLEVPPPDTPSFVDYPPVLFTEAPAGRWSWSSGTLDREAYVRVSVTAPPGTSEGWLQLASGGAYSLFVNGFLIGARDPALASEEEEPPRGRKLNLYNLSRFLRRGDNVIAIAATAEPSLRRLLLSGVLLGRDGRPIARFATPGDCRVSAAPAAGWTGPDFDDRGWGPLGPVPAPVGATDLTPTQRFVRPSLEEGDRFLLEARQLAVVLAVALGSLFVWAAAAVVLVRTQGLPLEQALARQGTPFLWSGLVLLAALLLGYDVRFGRAYPFDVRFLLAALAAWLLGQALAIDRAGGPASEMSGRPASESRPAPRPRRGADLAFLAAAIALAAAGFWVRAQGAATEPLTGDEVTMALVSDAIWQHGFPVGMVASNLPLKYFTTSEAVPFPMALWIRLLGLDERGVRMNGVVFGALTVLLLALAGRDLFDRRTGLLAALVFAFLPFAIKMSHYARYPSQLGFFTLLTVWLFERAVRGERIHGRRLAAATAAAALTYLTWEGVAFVGPAVLFGLIAYKRRDLRWLGEARLWLAAAAFALVVFLQLSLRIHLNVDWPRLGIGINQISPTALWNQPLYDPWSYRGKFFAIENLQVTSLLAVLGLLFAWRDRVLSYVLGILLVTFALMTNLLETQDSRHVYHLLAPLLLVSSQTLWRVCDRLAEGGAPARLAQVLARAAVVGLFLLATNTYVLKLYALPGSHKTDDVRLEACRPAGVSVAFGAFKHARAVETGIISYQPHVAYFYLGRADYYIENRLQIPVAVASDQAVAVHRLVGAPLVFTRPDLEEALSREPRAALVAPETGARLISKPVRKLLNEQMKVVYEDERVRLYSNAHLPFRAGDPR